MFAEVCISLALVAMALFVFFAVRTRRTSSNRFSLLLAGIFVSSFLMFLPTVIIMTRSSGPHRQVSRTVQARESSHPT